MYQLTAVGVPVSGWEEDYFDTGDGSFGVCALLLHAGAAPSRWSHVAGWRHLADDSPAWRTERASTSRPRPVRVRIRVEVEPVTDEEAEAWWDKATYPPTGNG